MKYLSIAGARRRACVIGFAAAALLAAAPARAHESCAAEGVWTVPGGGRISAQEILGRAAAAQVVLLGESHDNADHHRWELQMASALAALRPKIALGFEMFPRRVQAELGRWVAGELTQEQFLKAADWSQVWGHDAALYLPLFQFARLNRIPMLALNVERALVRSVGAHGLAAVPPDQREGISKPAEPSAAYLSRLFDAYAQHPERNPSAPARSDPAFRRFVEAQLVWDRAMAQALWAAAARDPDALVVGVMGARHVTYGEGVQHQLMDLGIQRMVSLLPWDHDSDCADFSTGMASAVYGIPYQPPEPAAPPPPLLGIRIDTAADGVRVVAVSAGSIAEAAGLQAEDVLTEAAGTAVKTTDELKHIVVRTAPGTWLPLKARRNSAAIELTAKFPPAR
ncbi:MAG: ChaN family lipoprotein [Pseudomonadota bacterium]